MISIVSAVRNRDSIYEASQSWVICDDIDHIIVVDYGSNPPLQNLHPKIQVVRVEAEHFHLTKAFNIGVAHAPDGVIIKLDADYCISPNFARLHPMRSGIFYAGGHKEVYCKEKTGLCIFNKSDFDEIGGYDERMVLYGMDDFDLYDRLMAQQIHRIPVKLEKVIHIPHEINLEAQKVGNAINRKIMEDARWTKEMKRRTDAGLTPMEVAHHTELPNLGLDGAFIINMDSQPEKYQRSLLRLQAVGCGFCERFPAIVPTDAGAYTCVGEQGIVLSVIEVLKLAQQRGYRSVLVMEDDVVFHHNFKKLWAKLLPSIQAMTYDVCYGYDWYRQASQDVSEPIKLVSINRNVCMHFAIFNGKYIPKAIELIQRGLKFGIANDRALDSFARMVAPSANIVGQEGGISSCFTLTGAAKEMRWRAS